MLPTVSTAWNCCKLGTSYEPISCKTMSTIEKIEAEALKLSPEELSELMERLLALDEERWDKQIEEDVAAGKLDALGEEAVAEYKAETF